MITWGQRINTLETQYKETNEKVKLLKAIIDVLTKDYGVEVKKNPLVG